MIWKALKKVNNPEESNLYMSSLSSYDTPVLGKIKYSELSSLNWQSTQSESFPIFKNFELWYILQIVGSETPAQFL